MLDVNAEREDENSGELRPLLTQSKLSAGRFISNPKDLLRTGGPILLITVASGFSAYGFVLYSGDFLYDHGVGTTSFVIGVACGVPIMALSGTSGGRALASLLANIKVTLISAGKTLVSFGIWNRADLWYRGEPYSAPWYLLQFVNGLAGFIKFVATPLSVIASDAQNYKRSKTWLSAGPNTATSYLMNSFYLGKAWDQALNTLAARLTDSDTMHRHEILRLLSGVKHSLQDFASENVKEFLDWLTDFKNCQTEHDKIIALAHLQILIPIPNPEYYQLATSYLGLLMLIPALVFTLPLVHAGEIAQSVFGKNTFSNFLFTIFKWPLISASSFLCNIMINGENAYHFGHDLPRLLADTTIPCRAKMRHHPPPLHGKEYIIPLIAGFSILVSLCAAFAQATTAYDNPLTAYFLWTEVILVFIAAAAIYFRASNSNINHIVNFIHRWRLQDIDDFSTHYDKLPTSQEKHFYLEVLSKVALEHVHDLEQEVQRIPYDVRQNAVNRSELTVLSLANDETVRNAIRTMPKQRSSCCSEWFRWFKSAPQSQAVVDDAAMSVAGIASAANSVRSL